MTKFLTTAALILGMVLGSALFSVDAQPGHSISAPKYTTANLPTCSSAVNAGRMAWDTTSVSFKVCDGSSFEEQGGVGGLTVGTQNTIAKFGAADLADSRITDDGADIVMTTDQLDILSANPYLGIQDGAVMFIGDVTDVSSELFSAYVSITPDATSGDGAGKIELGGMVGASNPAVAFILQDDGINSYTQAMVITEQTPDMDGDDTQIVILIDPRSVNTHTGANNTKIIMDFDTVILDADYDLTAILIESGYDYGLSILADGSATTNNITLGASQTTDAQIYFNGSALVLDVDGAANDVFIDLANNSGAVFTVGNTGFVNTVTHRATNPSSSGVDLVDIVFTSLQNVNGSDIINVFKVDFNDTSWATGSDNELRGIDIDSVTADADALYIGVNIGSGWDIGILNGARYVDTVQAVTGSDGGGRVTVTITPITSYVEMDCQDADTGCLLALSETGAVEGQRLTVVLVGLSAGDVTVPDEANVLNGTTTTLVTVDDSISFVYTGAIWVETSVSLN